MKTLLIGTGNMARHYSAALVSLGAAFDVVGHSQTGKEKFMAHTAQDVFPGSLTEYLANHQTSQAIVATSVMTLPDITRQLADRGVLKILVEKPVATTTSDLEDLNRHVTLGGAEVYVALNRRFFDSVQMARTAVAGAQGPVHLSFRFDDRISSIPFHKHPPEVVGKWVIANSIHVIDAAFFICGWPESLDATVAGGLSWHPTAERFSGFGALPREGGTFEYLADWSQDGNWHIEIRTEEVSLRLSPLEKLSENRVGQRIWVEQSSGGPFSSGKPGLAPMVSDFLGPANHLDKLNSFVPKHKLLSQIGGYLSDAPA